MGLLFIESIKCLYLNKKIDKEKIVELFECGKITEKDKSYILDVENK